MRSFQKTSKISALQDLNERSIEIFRRIVEDWLAGGQPIGSAALSRSLPLSAATIRHVMAELEALGLLWAPHISAGRVPTDLGLRLFVDGLLEVEDLSRAAQRGIGESLSAGADTMEAALTQASEILAELSCCAGLVMAPHLEARRLKHIEFVALNRDQALVIIVTDDGLVENRLMDLPAGLPPTSLIQATNYLNRRLRGRSLRELKSLLDQEMKQAHRDLDDLTQRLVAAGIAVWTGTESQGAKKSLIVRGRHHLLDNILEGEELERVRELFDDLETKTELLNLLERAEDADGVKIFIGSETKLFSLSGSSLIVSPYRHGGAQDAVEGANAQSAQNAQSNQIVGAIGIIGPTRLNYARIIPIVDYTARMIGQFLHPRRAAPLAEQKERNRER